MFDSPYSSDSFEPLLDSDRAAAIIRVHPKTLQRYARIGIVHGVRVGKLWRFRAITIATRASGAASPNPMPRNTATAAKGVQFGLR